MPEILYNIAMDRFLKLFIILFTMCLLTQTAYAQEYRVLVLPDNIQFDSTNYFIYQDSSVMFATDTINEFKKDARIQTVSMSEVRDTLRKNTKLNILTKNALKEFKYNYNIPFVDFKSIAHCFGTDKVLVITSQTDAQNYILRRTIWDILDIPGSPVVNPAYKLTTYAALIDVDKEQVLWQKTYNKIITSVDGRILAQNFAPATEQLDKLRSYSLSFLSPNISQLVQTTILPPLVPQKKGATVNVSNTNDGAVIVPPLDDTLELLQKKLSPKTNSNGYGEAVNDL